MTDWRMVVETFPDGRQTFPRLTGPPRTPRTGPRLVVTTMQYVRAHRGEFVFNDYGSRLARGRAQPRRHRRRRSAEYRGRRASPTAPS